LFVFLTDVDSSHHIAHQSTPAIISNYFYLFYFCCGPTAASCRMTAKKKCRSFVRMFDDIFMKMADSCFHLEYIFLWQEAHSI
jgi:hypothetical protein